MAVRERAVEQVVAAAHLPGDRGGVAPALVGEEAGAQAAELLRRHVGQRPSCSTSCHAITTPPELVARRVLPTDSPFVT